MCNNHIHINAEAVDPTRMKTEREAMLIRIRKVMRGVLKDAILWVKEQKEQGLYNDSPESKRMLAQKVAQLKQKAMHRIHLELLNSGETTVGWWLSNYIDNAYRKGVNRAVSLLHSSGIKIKGAEELQSKNTVSFLYNRPESIARRDALDLGIFSRFNGVCDELVSKIQSTVLSGITYGLSPYDVAQSLRKVVKLSSNQAQTIARTEMIRAHHTANIQTFRDAGVAGVKVLAEFLTVAGENGNPVASRVCEKCWELQKKSENKPYTLDEAEKLIPVHPNCRCVVIPVLPEVEEKSS